jgi:hypothetical protein
MTRSKLWAMGSLQLFFFFAMIFGAEVYATSHKMVYIDKFIVDLNLYAKQ